MEEITALKPLAGKKSNSPHPLSRPSERYSENILTPVTLFGVIVPWREFLGDGKNSDYKLVCASGVEYFVIADAEWRVVLTQYRWEQVKVKGLLNVSNMTLVPQMVFPKGSSRERENVIAYAAWKGRDLAKKLKTVSDLILAPTAVLTLMMV
jgi:hypothetical protein